MDLSWLTGDIAGPWGDNRRFFVIMTSGCVLLPLVVIPTFHKLRFISSLSVASMLFVTFVVAFRASQAATRDELPCLSSWNDAQCAPIRTWVWSSEIFNAISTVAFAFDVGAISHRFSAVFRLFSTVLRLNCD